MALGGVDLRPWRSRELRGSQECQNGGLRALEEAWMMTFRSRLFSVKFGGFLVSGGSRLDAGGTVEEPRVVMLFGSGLRSTSGTNDLVIIRTYTAQKAF